MATLIPLEKGYEVVYGRRVKRDAPWLMQLAYKGFYRIFRKLSYLNIPLDAGDFCLMDRRVVNALVGMPEHNRFLRGMRSWLGFKQTGVPFERAARNAGQPKYTLRKLVKLAASPP